MMRVGVIGASGLVGQRLLKLLSHYALEIIPLGRQSREIWIEGQSYQILAVQGYDLSQLDGVFMVSGAEEARGYYPRLRGWVVDASTASYEDMTIPMVVPEVYAGPWCSRMISPNCIAIPMALVLSWVNSVSSVISIWGSTYQSISGAGFQAFQDYQAGKGYDQLNPVIGGFSEGMSQEEWCIQTSLDRILGYRIPMEILAVRVPVSLGHGMHIRLECSSKIDRSVLLDKLKDCPYIQYREGYVPSNRDVRESAKVFVGRVKVSERYVDLWVISDNLWRGAAWNMVQIAKQYYGITEKFCEHEKTE